jgi:hypothetical protein
MESPAQRRFWVRWVQEAFAVSEMTACDARRVQSLSTANGLRALSATTHASRPDYWGD